jgi:hypothetical protein
VLKDKSYVKTVLRVFKTWKLEGKKRTTKEKNTKKLFLKTTKKN